VTRVPADLLERSPEESARLLALSFLQEATTAERRFRDPEDSEALHDFRVAIRRLRSTCRAYRPYLETSISNKLRRRLRGLTEATNAGRDAQVMIAWLRSRRDDLGETGRSGADWLVVRLTEQGSTLQPIEAGVSEEWRDISSTLKRRLSEFPTVVHLGRSSRHPPFGHVAGSLVQEHAAALRARLAAVTGRDDAAEAHRARINAKRLRYLLEPLVRRSRVAKGLVEGLKGLQDLLGDLRDMQVLALEITQAVEDTAAVRAGHMHRLALDAGPSPERPAAEGPPDEGAGLVDLAKLAQERGDTLFQEVDRDWLAGRAEPFLAKVEGFGQSLARRRRAQVEIERKFLLNGLPERVKHETASELSQGWIPGTELQERVRRMRCPDGETFTRTLKFGNGMRRTEIEEETTREVFDSLWPLTAGRRVEKRRFAVPDGDLVWEVDEFGDRELVLAEIELPSEGTKVKVPEWLEPYVVREVTDEPEYVNLNLAK